MENNGSKQTDFASRIRALSAAPASDPQPPQPPIAGGTAPAVPEPPASAPAGPASPAAGIIVEEWLYDWDGLKVHRKHADLVRRGVDPHDIKHIPRGFDKGCACHECMVGRGRARNVTSSAGPVVQVKDPLLAAVLTESLVGRILDAPNRIAEAVLRFKGLPEEAVAVWKTDPKTIAWYGSAGKQIADHYLDLSGYKNAPLYLFIGAYLADSAERATLMTAILKGQSNVR